MIEKSLPLFIIVFWFLFGLVANNYYYSSSGQRQGFGPSGSLLLWPVIPFIALFGSFVITDHLPVMGTWAVYALHLQFVVGLAILLILRKRR
jgi:hypothetical protein